MSDRGLLLALQRLHDDPGFVDVVAQNPEETLALYDLSDEERQELSTAVVAKDGKTIDKMAEEVGMDWTADHIPGAGALADDEVSLEGTTRSLHEPHSIEFTNPAYDAELPQRSSSS